MTAYSIRKATPSDVRTLGQFGSRLTQLHHEFDPRRFIGTTDLTPSRYADYLARQLSASDVIVLTAEANGAPVGYSYGGIEGPDYMALRGPAGVIYDLFVDPGSRGDGIGAALLDAMIDAIRKRGSERIVLSTAYKNFAAQRLFAARGFRPTMVEMTRDLNG